MRLQGFLGEHHLAARLPSRLVQMNPCCGPGMPQHACVLSAGTSRRVGGLIPPLCLSSPLCSLLLVDRTRNVLRMRSRTRHTTMGACAICCAGLWVDRRALPCKPCGVFVGHGALSHRLGNKPAVGCRRVVLRHGRRGEGGAVQSVIAVLILSVMILGFGVVGCAQWQEQHGYKRLIAAKLCHRPLVHPTPTTQAALPQSPR